VNDRQDLSGSEKRLIELFEKDLKFENGRYETKLLWRVNPGELENNYSLAKRRFDQLRKGFAKNKWVADEYKEIINDQIEKGIIEECERDKNEYFMPHRAVVRRDKETTKVRVVFNCSSKSRDNFSLNDCLETGPNLNPNVLDVILNFRKFEIAFNADIEKAFLMIGISESERKYLKFLWYSDNPKEECKIMRMKRLPFRCKTSPFILSAVIKHHIKKFESDKPNSVEMLNSALYVDDLYFGAHSVNEAFALSSDAVSILKSGGFNLRKLRSNSSKLEKLWAENGLSEGERAGVVKVLGLNWSPDHDVLSLELKGLSGSLKTVENTKRFVLQTAARIFDPIGLIAPFVVRIKCLLQEIWERGIDWDENLPEDLRIKWIKLCEEIEQLSEIGIPRNCLQGCSDGKVEVHVFCDASPKAYGAVAYLRYFDKSRKCRVSFIMSKSRVAPLKKLTLPSLELMAIVVGAKMGKYIKGIYNDLVDKFVFWTDSLITLYWVKGCAKRWKQFVSNRVLEVQENSDPKSWFYCPTGENPADLLTRGVLVESLIRKDLWWNGPCWLRDNSDCWPKQLLEEFPDLDDVKVEEKVASVKSFVVGVELANFWSFSSWSKLLRVMAWCLRFVDKVKGLRQQPSFLEVGELQRAEKFIIKAVQADEFSDEIHQLQTEKTVNPTNKLSQLNPFLDEDGLLCVGGRLANANLPFRVKHPYILPKSHSVTSLIVRFYHIKYLHAGIKLLHSSIKQRFWIIGSRSIIRRIVKDCVICVRFRSELSKQIMADLPATRVNPGRAFLRSGTDFCEPFLVTPRRARGIKPLKMYVCVFVCFTTKAIHLELISDLSSDACISGLKRFIGRRGKPLEIYSDCGTNFIGTKNNLLSWQTESIGRYLVDEGVKWKHIVPSAPHFGGLWEAAVKSMKFHLKRVLGTQILSQEEFTTVLVEIEAVLNSRPLVAASDDPDDYTAITPGHFLIGSELKRLPEPDFTELKIPIRERLRLISQISQSFWKSWSKDYLTQLQERNKWRKPFENLKVNDLVLIKEDNLPPIKWKLARVSETYKGTDNFIRAVNLKTSAGEIRRPIHKLVRLPIDCD